MTVGHCIDHGGWSQHRVTACEQTRDAGGERVLVGHDPPAGAGDHAQPGRVDPLADGHDHRVSHEDGGPQIVELGIETPLLVEHARAGSEGHPRHLAPTRLDPRGPETVVEDDSLLERLGCLPGVGRHLRAALETRQMHRRHAGQPAGATRGIHGNVAAADDQDGGPESRCLTTVDQTQEIQTFPDARSLFADDAQFPAHPGSRRCEHSFEPGLQEARRVGDARARLGLHTQVEDVLDLLVQDVLG